MTKLKCLLTAMGWPFAKPERKPPRIVATFRRREDQGGVTVSLEARDTSRADEYELKCMACILFALSRGLRARIEETGNTMPNFAKTADTAQTMACLLMVQAEVLS